MPTEWWLRPLRSACARRRAQRGRVEARVLEAVRGEPLSDRRGARPTERAGRAKADVVEQDDQDVRSARRRAQRLDRREGRVRVLRVIGRQADRRADQGSAERRVGCRRASLDLLEIHRQTDACATARAYGLPKGHMMPAAPRGPGCRTCLILTLPSALASSATTGLIAGLLCLGAAGFEPATSRV